MNPKPIERRLGKGPACGVVLLRHKLKEMGAELSRLRRSLHKEKERRVAAERATLADPLTGAFNRRGLEQKFGEELSKVKRFGRGLCIVFFDVDNFKAFNSMHGQRAGDRVLGGIVECVKGNLRQYDSVHRIGGEEFVVLLPETDSLRNATIVAERLRRRIEEQGIDYDGKVLRASVSMGVAMLSGEDGLQQLIDNANRAEMEAKKSGKNRVFVFSGEEGAVPAEEYMKKG